MEVQVGNWKSTWTTADEYISRFNPKSTEHTQFHDFQKLSYTPSPGVQVKVVQIGTTRKTSPGIGSKINYVPNSERELPGVEYIEPVKLDLTAKPFDMYNGVSIPEFGWTRPAQNLYGTSDGPLITPNQLGQY